MSHRHHQKHARHDTEKSFIDDLINNALIKFEQTRSLPLRQQDTISRLAKYRVNIVATKLEKLLSKKTLDYHSFSSRGQELSSTQKTKFVEELLLLLDMIHEITTSYSATHLDTIEANENAEVLSKHTCSKLISTVGGVVYFQSQFQEPNNSRRLSAACGGIIRMLSELSEECTLFHVSQLLKQCVEPHAEARGSFYNLQTLQYIRLKTDGMLILFSLLANVIDQPTNALNPNFGNWKKSAMLEISAPLRVCILKWLESDPSAMSDLLITPSNNDDNNNMLALYSKIEPWANGAKRKSSVWPVMCLLLALMPNTFSAAINDRKKKSSTSRVLRKTVDNLNVSTMRSVLQKDSVLNTELSVISIVLMFKVAASLQRSLCYSAMEPSSSSSSFKSYSFTTDNDTQELPNQHMNELRQYLMPTVDRVRDLIFSGHYPSHLYYNAITEKTYPCMVMRHTDEKDRDHGALCFECEHSQEYLLNTFLWSLFYVDQPRYLQLMTHIHHHNNSHTSASGKEVQVSLFARAHSIRSLNSILTSDSVDRAGRSPTWRIPEASVVRSLVLGIIKNYVSAQLQNHGIDDYERLLLSPRVDRSDETIELDYKSTRKWTVGGNDNRDRESKQESDLIVEVLHIFVINPWFLYVHQSVDVTAKREGIIISPFTAQLTLVLRDITSIIRHTDDESLAVRAEEAFLSLLDVKYVRLWNPQDPFIGVLTVHSVVLKHLSYQLLRCQAVEGQVIDRLLRCVHRLLKNVNTYLEEDHLLRDLSISAESLQKSTYNAIQQSIWLTEASLLLHSCSAESEIIQQVMQCFELWCTYTTFVSRIEFPHDIINAHSDEDDNIENSDDDDHNTSDVDVENEWRPYYLKIRSPEYTEVLFNYSEMSNTVGNILSQKLQQKSIRSFLHNMPCRTLGMNWALTAVMKRWEKFNEKIFMTTKINIPDSAGATFDEWTNCTGFLCAMGSGLFTTIASCGIDSMVPYLGGPDYEYHASRSRCSTTSGASSGNEMVDALSYTTTSTCTKLIKQLLYLILIQHTEKRVSFDVFFAIGLYLSPPLIHHLFRELYIILDVMTDVLSKRCDACTTNPQESSGVNTTKHQRSKSPNTAKDRQSSFIQSFTDFDTFIAEMPLMSLNNFMNAILTMLQLIFDREWRKPDRDGSMPLGGKPVTGSNEARDSFDDLNMNLSGNQIICLVEKLFHKIVVLESKLHRQLEISDSDSNNSLTGTPALTASPLGGQPTTSAKEKDNFISEQFRLRKKMAFMIETFTLQMTPLCKISPGLQMKLLSVLMDWVYDCIGYLSTTSHSHNTKKSMASTASGHHERHLVKSRSIVNLVDSKDNITLYQSTQLASIKAIAALLKGFELIATVDGTEDEVNTPAPTPAPAKSTHQGQMKTSEFYKVSKAFYRAFHVLHKLLATCLVNADENSQVTRIITVNSLCNLLHANTGIGLKHVIEAVHSSENQQIRGILLTVFTETLSRRVDLNFGDGNKPIEESYEDCLFELLLLVIAPNRELIRLLCFVTRSGKDASLMATALLKLFEALSPSTTSPSASSAQHDVLLLEWAIQFEVSQTPRLGSLFRSESLSTKLMGSYFSSKGLSYLRNTLRAPIQLFLDQAPCVEVDPHKGVKAEEVDANTSILLQFTELFLDSIVASVNKCPKEMRHILFVLKNEATLRFAGLEADEGSERVAIAGYMFLRFFCPAIAMPTKFDLVNISSSSNVKELSAPILSRQSSRGLLLIAKILQNLANGTHFFEEYLAPLNSWIDDHAKDITKFTTTIAVIDRSEEIITDLEEDMLTNIDDSRVGANRVGSSHSSYGSGSSDLPSSLINEKQVDILVSIHTFLYFNSDRIERLLYPIQKTTSNDVEIEIPISPGLVPHSVGRQTSGNVTTETSNHESISGTILPGVSEGGSDYMNIRDPLTDLLHKLGEPPENIGDNPTLQSTGATRGGPNSGKNNATSACSVFMSDFESRPDYSSLLQNVRDSMIFYNSNLSAVASSSNRTGIVSSKEYSHEIFFFIARRVTSETDPLALIYQILQELQRFVDSVLRDEKGNDEKSSMHPVFDLVIDSSSFNADSELPMWSYTSFWSKLKSLIGHTFGKYIQKVYVMYPSVVLLMSTQKILKKWGLKTKSVMEKVEVCTPTQLISKYPTLHEKIPHSTYNIEITSLKHWPAVFQDQQVLITISDSLLLVQSKEKIAGLEFTRTDMLMLHLIESIFKSSNGSNIKSKKHGDKMSRKKFALPSSKGGLSIGDDKKDHDKSKNQPLVVINYTAFHSKRTLKLQFTHTSQFVSALSIALTHVRQQRALEEASESVGTDALSPDAIPGILLNAAIVNLFSDSEATRKASYRLLCQLKETYELPLLTIPTGSAELSALFIPSNLIHYCVSMSSEIASSRPEYGREFIVESFMALKRDVTSQSQKIALILCVAPWIPYLGLYLDYARERDNQGMTTGINTDDLSINDSCRSGSGSSSPVVFVSTPDDEATSCRTTLSRTPSKSGAHSPAVNIGSGHNTKGNTLRGGLIHNSVTQQVRRSSLITPSIDRSSSTFSNTSASISDQANSVQDKYDFLGSRITHAESEELRQEIENIMEIVIHCSSEDESIAKVCYLQFWENVGHLPQVSTLAVNYFIKRLLQEGYHHGAVKIDTGAKKHEGDSAGAGINVVGSKISSKTSKNLERESREFLLEIDDVLVSPFSLHDHGIDTQIPDGGSMLGVRSSSKVANKLSYFGQQGQCRCCITICEVIALLSSKSPEIALQNQNVHQPIVLCMLFVDKIQEIVEDIFKEEHKDCIFDQSLTLQEINASTIDFNIDINDTYIKVPGGDDEGQNKSNKMYDHILSPKVLDGQLEPKSINMQLFARSDMNSEHDDQEPPSAPPIASPDQKLRQNLDSFFTLPIPPSPSNTPQKQKNINIETTGRSSEKMDYAFPPGAMTSFPPSSPLNSSLNNKWVEVVSLLRPILHLIGQNSLVLEHCTPALLHMCLKLIAKGPRSLRPGVFSLLSTLVHALLSESSDEYDANSNKFGTIDRSSRSTHDLESNGDNGERLSGNDGCSDLYIFSGATASMWKDISLQVDSPAFHHIFNKSPELTSHNFELVVRLITDVVACPTSGLSAKWKQDLWNIALLSSIKKFTHSISATSRNGDGGRSTSTVVRAACPVYPSYFYLLGNLIDVHKADKEYFQQILSSFHDVIKLCGEYNFVDNKQDVKKDLDNIEDKMLRPIFFCLRCSLKYLDLLGLQKLFWCAVLLLQYFPEHYMSGPVLLLHGVVDELLSASSSENTGDKNSKEIQIDTSIDNNERKIYSKQSLTSALLSTRRSDPVLRDIFNAVETSGVLGISFESSFATALTSTLLRVFNVKDAKTKGLTLDILQRLLQHDQLTYRRLLSQQSPRNVSVGELEIENVGTPLGVSGYCPILLPHLGLEETLVSRASLVPNDDFDNMSSDTCQNDLLPSFSGLSKPTLVKKKSIPNNVNLMISTNVLATTAPKAAFPTYLAALSPSAKSQFVSPSFFGVHNFPTDKSIVLFVTSLLSYLRLLAQSVYSDEEQQSHSFAFIILLQVLREVPVALNKLYQVIFAELNTTYNISLQRNQHLADIVLEAIHECLLSQAMVKSVSNPHHKISQGSELADSSDDDDDIIIERKNIQIKTRPAVIEDRSSIASLLLDRNVSKDITRDCDSPHLVNVMREDVEFHSDEEEHCDYVNPNALQSSEATDMAYLAEIGFPALLCGPYNYIFTVCEQCQSTQLYLYSCPCYTRRRQRKELLSDSVALIIDSLIRSPTTE